MILEVREGDYGVAGYGFFANFFKALSAIIIAREGVDKVIIDMNLKGVNLWEKIFLRVDEYTDEERSSSNKKTFVCLFPSVHDVQTYGLNNFPYPLSHFNGYIFMDPNIYIHPLFNEIRKLYNSYIQKIKPRPELEAYLNEHLDKIKNPDKTLALFFRQQIHFYDLNDNYLQNVMKEVDSVIDKYENLLLLTQVKVAREAFKEKYGDKLIYFEDRPSLDINQDWAENPDLDLDKEFRDSFTDSYVASKCKFILGGASCMVLGALCLNPDIEFKILDCLKHCRAK